MISELAVKMLGYESSEEFEKATNNSMIALLYEKKFHAEQFVALEDCVKHICVQKMVLSGLES